MAEPLTTAEAAEILNVSVSTVNRWAADGRLPTAKKLDGPRGDNLFDRDVIEAEAQARRVAPPISA